MPLTLRVKFEMERPPEVSIRAWRQIMRDAHREQGEEWFKRYAHLHFESAGARRYRYPKRSPNTIKRKLRAARGGRAKQGGTVDLVWTGLTKQVFLGGRQVRGFPTRATVTQQVPRYITLRNRKTGRSLADQVGAIASDEGTFLGRFLERRATTKLNAVRARKTVHL